MDHGSLSQVCMYVCMYSEISIESYEKHRRRIQTQCTQLSVKPPGHVLRSIWKYQREYDYLDSVASAGCNAFL